MDNPVDNFWLAPPTLEEAAPFYAGFLGAFPDGRVGYHLRAQPAELARLCANLEDPAALYAYAPGKWTIKQVVGHLLDCERVFAYRLLRLGRGDPTPLEGFDENHYAASGQFNRRSIAALIDEFAAVRAGTQALVLGIPEEGWSSVGVANGYSTSARALVYIILGHTAHHLEGLRSRYGLPRGD